jgi:phosphoglycerol transferase MdoB-like AlkP superfamily enzyme
MDDADPQARSTEALRQLVADMVLWFALVLLFIAFRATLFWIFRAEQTEELTAQSLRRCFETGLRSDSSAATWAILPSLALTLLGFIRPLGQWHQRVRGVVIVVVVVLCGIVFVADVGYFAEYDNQFDHWIFGLVYDDARAIFTTIWKSYHVIFLVVVGAVAVSAAAWSLQRLTRAALSAQLPRFIATKWMRAFTLVLVLAWTVIGTRTWPHGHLVSVKNAPGTGDTFLNKIVLNPFFALRYAIWQERNMQKIAGLRTILPSGDIRAAATALYPQTESAKTLDDCLSRTAPGNPNPRPDHVFIIVMESYDAWAMEPEFATLHLTDRLSALGRDGIFVRSFVSSGSSTMQSLGTIITGLPFARVLVNYQSAIRNGVPTAIATVFKQLGYRTRYFLGTNLNWERSGQFCREQGFEEVYGGDQMPVQSGRNEWGVDDEDLFRFVLERTGSEPTFNLIMTSSYHPPYSVDVEKKGFDLNQLKSNPICAGLSKRQLQILGHLWYSDKCVADFVAQAQQKFERPLFAITGDHYSRKKFVSVRPMNTIAEQVTVPLVICGQRALENAGVPTASLAGSHLDILPTVVDLAAPAGFVYHAFGRDLLDRSQSQTGFGCNTVVGPDFIFRVRDPAHVEDLRGNAISNVDAKKLALRYRELEALGWWRAVKGKEWPANSPTLSYEY